MLMIFKFIKLLNQVKLSGKTLTIQSIKDWAGKLWAGD